MTPARILLRLRAELAFSGVAAWRAIVRLVTGNDLTHAASIAYYALLSLFPFLLLLISLLGSIAADEEDRLSVLTFVFFYFPTQFEFVDTQLDAFRQSSVQVGIGGALALIWASLGVFGALTSAINEAWGVEKQRSFWRHRMVSFLMLVASGGVVIVALLLVSAVEVAEASWFGGMLAQFEWLQAAQTLTFTYAATVLLILGIGLLYYFIPNAKTRFRDVWVGAVLTGILWRLAFSGFSWYVAQSRMTLVHGSIATVVVFLLWIYVSSVILMYGVEFTAAYARMRRRRPEEMPAAPTPRV